MKITVNADAEYDVFIEKGIIYRCGEYIKEHAKGKKVVIISDNVVFRLYGSIVASQLEALGYKIFVYLVASGEVSKNLKTVNDIVLYMSSNFVSHNDTIIALGGGVVGDVSSFAASIYKGSVACIHIPTTLMAQADGSVGGKAGLNVEQFKDMLSVVHPPKTVIIDPLVLSTLSPRDFFNGLAEIIKLACVYDNSFFQQFKNNECDSESIIKRSASIKKAIHEQSCCDGISSQLLNFGHIIGHAVELCCAKYRYSFLHGEAVAIGMCRITEITESLGLTKQGTALQVRSLLARNNLPTDCPELLKPDMQKCILNDKRVQQGKISVVYLKEIGRSDIVEMNVEEFMELI